MPCSFYNGFQQQRLVVIAFSNHGCLCAADMGCPSLLADEDDDVPENVGYLVPAEVLLHFLEDYNRHGRSVQGFPNIGIRTQVRSMTEFKLCLHMLLFGGASCVASGPLVPPC